MKKRRITDFASGIVVGAVLFSGIAYADSDAIKLIVNGKQVQSDVPPVVIDGHTMVPIRTVAESLGLDVKWDGNNRAVVINGSGNGTPNVGNTPTDLPSSGSSSPVDITTLKFEETSDAVRLNKWKDEKPFMIAGNQYDKGIGMAYNNVLFGDSIGFYTKGKYTQLTGVFGVDDRDIYQGSSSNITIYGDGKQIFTSDYVGIHMQPIPISVDVTGVNYVKIFFNGHSGNNPVLANAQLK